MVGRVSPNLTFFFEEGESDESVWPSKPFVDSFNPFMGIGIIFLFCSSLFAALFASHSC